MRDDHTLGKSSGDSQSNSSSPTFELALPLPMKPIGLTGDEDNFAFVVNVDHFVCLIGLYWCIW